MSFEHWYEAAERRYLADLTRAELGRALRALSSCYVERRGRLAEGAALATKGKRAAFALFYAPLHFLTVREIAAAAGRPTPRVIDLGCGTGAAGAAWAVETGAQVLGFDLNAWAVAEANWTYRQLAVDGVARKSAIETVRFPNAPGTILAAWAVNELPDAVREQTCGRLLDAAARGHDVVVIEPIARRMSPWWTRWQAAFEAAGGTAREWRFAARLPPPLRQLDRAAGLSHQELTARTLMLGRPGR